MKKSLAAILCFAVSVSAATFMLYYVDYPARLGPNGMTIISVAALVFMVFGITGFVFFLWTRCGLSKRPNFLKYNPEISAATQPSLKDGVYGLIPGATYRVVRTITDHYQGVFPVGEELTFIERHFLPYEGGHTLIFDKRSMYLQDGADTALNALDTYLTLTAEPLNLVKVEGALAAHFKQPDSPSRPGVDWKMSLTESPATIFFVHTLYPDSVRPGSGEQVRLRHRAVTFVNARLSTGWRPAPGERIEAKS